MDVHDQQQLKKSRVVRVNSEEVMGFLYHSSCQSRLPCDGAFYCCLVHMPSVAMNPFFEELAFNYQDRGVALKMEIKAMPIFLMMKGGGSTDKLVGANPDAIKKMLKS